MSRQSQKPKLVDVDCLVIKETEKAYCIEFVRHGETDSAWVPKSQVEWHERDHVMVVPMWIAMEKELI